MCKDAVGEAGAAMLLACLNIVRKDTVGLNTLLHFFLHLFCRFAGSLLHPSL